MHIRLLAAAYLLPFAAVAQAMPPAPPAWAVRWAPLSLLDPRRPTLQLGVEYFLTPSVSLGADVGTRLALPAAYRHPAENRQHHTYRLEGRYYVSPGRARSYVAAEAFFVPYRYTDRFGLLQRGSAYFTYDAARIRHNTWGTALKYGWRFPLGRHDRWWLETALSLGWRRKPARYSHLRNEQPADSATVANPLRREWTLGTQPTDGGYVDRLHVGFSLRVAYQFQRRAERTR